MLEIKTSFIQNPTAKANIIMRKNMVYLVEITIFLEHAFHGTCGFHDACSSCTGLASKNGRRIGLPIGACPAGWRNVPMCGSGASFSVGL